MANSSLTASLFAAQRAVDGQLEDGVDDVETHEALEELSAHIEAVRDEVQPEHFFGDDQ